MRLLEYLYGKRFGSTLNTPTISSWFFMLPLPIKMEQEKCSEMSVYKIQTPGNHTKGRTQLSEQGVNLELKFLLFSDTFHRITSTTIRNDTVLGFLALQTLS